jgi:hypothetical protein
MFAALLTGLLVGIASEWWSIQDDLVVMVCEQSGANHALPP